MMLLEMKGLKKCFPVSRDLWGKARQVVRAVDGIDAAIAPQEGLGLVGESGSGKTTLARMAVGLVSPDAGRIFVEGQDLAQMPPAPRRRLPRAVQMVFQDPFNSLDPRFTVENILKESGAFALLPRASAREQMQELLSAVGLAEGILERFPHEFSGGERQRLAIARALALHPRLLILDEAVSSLDVLVQEQILELLGSLKERFQVTYFFISHNLRVIKRLCSRMAVMYQGKIVEAGPSEVLLKDPLHPYTQELLSAAIHYQIRPSARSYDVSGAGQLREKQKQHFVLE